MRLELLGGLRLSRNLEIVPVSLSAQRVLAFLALRERPQARHAIAGALWLEATQEHANGSLRSAVWRLNCSVPGVLAATGDRLSLAGDVDVDLHRARAMAERVLESDAAAPTDIAAGLLTQDILPDWDEHWLALERERFRQSRLHALEALSERLVSEGRFGKAVEAGMAAVAADPLRESAHRAVIRTHLAEGNRGEALRQYRACGEMLHECLGLSPSIELQRLLRDAINPAVTSADGR